MTSTALLRCYYWPARIKHRCPRKPFLIAWLSHCGFMGGSCRSAIHCFWRRNRLPLLLEVFGIHLSKADRRSTTISGRTYRGLPHVAWDTRSEAVSTRRLSNQACHELDEIASVTQPFVIDWTTTCVVRSPFDAKNRTLKAEIKEEPVLNVVIDDVIYKAHRGELLVDLISRTGGSIPHVCYHPQLGPIKTCDTCMVEVNGQLVRACTATANEGMKISTRSSRASAAQVEAFDRILSSHLLYCTV